MSGDTETTQQTSQASTKNPWEPAAGTLSGILGRLRNVDPNLTGVESGALNSMLGNAGFLNQFTPQAVGLADTLLGGGTDRSGTIGETYDQYRAALTPFARGDYASPESNPVLQKYLGLIGNDVQNRVNAMYAGAGRDPSGAGSYGQMLGRGIAEGTAPVLLDAYNQGIAGQRSAIDQLYGAGGQTAGLLAGLDQTALSNRQAGLGVAGTAQDFANSEAMNALAVEAQRRGIPLQVLAQQMGIALPIGSAFGTTTGTGTEISTTQVPWYQPVIGGALAGAGLYGAIKKK